MTAVMLNEPFNHCLCQLVPPAVMTVYQSHRSSISFVTIICKLQLLLITIECVLSIEITKPRFRISQLLGAYEGHILLSHKSTGGTQMTCNLDLDDM